MLLILTLTLMIAAVPSRGEEESHSQSNSSTLYANTSDNGFVWADTDNPDCENNTCVRKCCESLKVYSFTENDCFDPLPNEQMFEAAFKYKDGQPSNATDPLLLLEGWPIHLVNCTMGPLPQNLRGHLLPNGSFYTPNDDAVHDILHYCLETTRKEGEANRFTAFTCFTPRVETTHSLFRHYAHSICLTASCIALSIVILCHVLIAKLRDLQGKCLLSHVCSLLAADISLLTATLRHRTSDWVCITLGITMHTAFIATYLWLTVMCFDIWRFVRMSVRGIPMQRVLGGEENKLYLSYCAVAWGIAGLIAAVTCTLQFLPDDALPHYIIRPEIGVTRCFIIDNNIPLWLYYFSFLGCLSALNMALVGKTAHYLYGRGLPVCRCCRSPSNTDTESSVFNAKHVDIFWQRFQIFITTIFIWTTEVLSFVIPPPEMWELTDVLNTLQGVIILLIFLRQKKKRALVMAMLEKMSNQARNVTQAIVSSPETSSVVISGTTSSGKLEGSDRDKIGRMRTNSREDQRVESINLQSVENVAQDADQEGVDNLGLVDESN